MVGNKKRIRARLSEGGTRPALPPLTPLRLAILAAVGVSPAAAGSQLVPDGRTQTSVDTQGSVSDVRTNTVRGANAFNSFRHFRVFEGNTVNLHLPDGTQNLVNLVHDSRAVIDGTLNGVLDGGIGGHIVFADPHGIVVGANGVLNVGSLLFAAPTAEFMDQVVAPDGSIGDAAVQRLLAGEAPDSGSGIIEIGGRVNAAGAIAIHGTDVAVTGSLRSASPQARQALFEASVNTDGIVSAVEVSEQGGEITIRSADDAAISGELDVAGSSADGGIISVRAGGDVALRDGAMLDAQAAAAGGDGGTIDIWADRDARVEAGVRFDASAGATGDGGFIEVSAARNVALDGINADLGAGAGGQAGEFLIDPITVTAGSTAYYTNGGDVTIIALDRITLDPGAVINTRKISGGDGSAVAVGEGASPGDNPAGLPDPTLADDPATASVGDSGNVTLQAPHIEIGVNAEINTFATDGYSAGDITLESGDNFTCNICQAPDVGEYFTDIESVGTPLTVSSTDDVSITVAAGAELDARYLNRAGYSGAAGEGGDVTLTATAADEQVAGYSQAGASVTVNGALRGANVKVSAVAKATVDFAWLASALDPANPTGSLELLQGISEIDFENFHQDAIENADDPTDITNLLGLGLPVTAGAVSADARVVIGDSAEIEASQDVTLSAHADRTMLGASGGLLAGSLPELGLGVIYGHLDGTTSVRVQDNAAIAAGGALTVSAESDNKMEVGASAQVTQSKDSVATKGNESLGFSLAIGYADVTTEAVVGADARIRAGDVAVKARGLDNFTTEANTLALTPTSGATAKAQGAMTVAISLWSTDVLAAFDAKLADGVELASLDVAADNLAETHVTKTTVQTGNNFFDYLMGKPANRSDAISSLLGGALGASGSSGAPKFAAAASIAVSNQHATARIGEGAVVRAAGDVTVRSRVHDQGIRGIADSRVNSTGPGSASVSGSVAFSYGQYNHSSQAIIGDGATVEAARIGVGARSELPIDNDYDEALSDFDVTDWDGPEDFFNALNTLAGAVMEPDMVAVESFGLADYLLTGYSNAYGTATEDGTAVFGSANVMVASHDTRAWVGEGAQLTASGADGEWTTEFDLPAADAEEDDPDLDIDTSWTWSGAVDVDARTRSETVGVIGNLSLLTLITQRTQPAGTSVGGSFGWTEFNSSTIAGIGDGAVVRSAGLDVQAHTDDRMLVIAPSAGVGGSVAGNGIFSYAQMNSTTHASIHSGARVEADSVDLTATEVANLWAIGGAVAVSDETSMGVAVAVDSVTTDTRAYIGDNSADRALEADEDSDGDGVADAPAADVAVADGSAAGVRTGRLHVDARSDGSIGAIGVAGAVASGSSSSSPTPPAPSPSPTRTKAQNGSFLAALQQAGQALGGGGSSPGQPASLTGAGSGTLNFSRLTTVAEVHDTALIREAGDPATEVRVRALTDVDQVSASGAAAVSLAGGGGGRSSALAGAVAYNDIDNHTRAGLYNVSGTVGDVDVLAASSGDALSVGVALAAASGDSTAGAAASVSIASVAAETAAEIVDSALVAAAVDDTVSVTGYDRSRLLAGGGALYLGLGGGSGGGVGLAATYGRVDNDVSAYVRGSSLQGFESLAVDALGASRILAAAFGGSVATGASFAGAGSLYIMTLEGDLAAGITGSYGTHDHDGDPATAEVTDYDDLLARSDVATSGNVRVNASSSTGVAELEALFGAGGLDAQADFQGNALADIDPAQVGIDPDGAGIPGEAVIGFAGSLGISGSNAAAGLAIGFTDLQGSYTAEIRDADVTASDGDVDVTAVNSRQAIGVAAGASVSGGGGISLLGSGAITLSDTTVTAQVLGESHLAADHVQVRAGAEGTIYSVAGAISATASGAAAIGAAASYNDIGGSVTARLGGNSVITDGADPAGEARSVDVSADQDADIYSVAVAGGAGGGAAAISGSATVNLIGTDTTARLDADAVTADTVRVRVRNGSTADRAGVWSLAGAVAVSNNAGVGAAFAINALTGTYDSAVAGTTFTGTSELTVHGTSASEVKTLAVAASGGGTVAAGVSDTTNTGNYAVNAGLSDVTLSQADARVEVYAADDSTIDSLAGAVQIGGTSAGGGAVAVNDLNADVAAGISGGSLDVENVLLQARSRTDIDTIAVGVAGSGSGAVSGSVAVNHVGSKTSAVIDGGAVVQAAHNVGVLAGSDDSVSVGAGSVGISAAVLGGAGSVTVNVMEGQTEAAIRGAGTRVEARGEDWGDTIDASGGELASTPSGNPFAELFGDGSGAIAAPDVADFAGYTGTSLSAGGNALTGVVVDAIALQQADTIVATVGVSADFVGGGAGVAGAVNTTVLGGSARALIEDATIGDAADRGANGNVSVAAGHHAYGTNVLLGLAAGSAGGVGTVGIDTYSGEATAAIRDSDVYAGGVVGVDAVSRRDILNIIGGVSVGTYGAGAGSGLISVFAGNTTAEVIGANYLEVQGLGLHADSSSEADLATIGIAGSGGGAGAGGFAVAVSHSDTTARIGNGSERTEVVTNGGSVSVEADSRTRLNMLTAAAAIGGGAVSGAVGVEYIGNTTTASIDDSKITSDGGLTVTADDDITLDTIAGAGSVGGFAGGVGVNIGVVKSATVARIKDSDVSTGGSVQVQAERRANLEMDSIVASVAFGGNAAVSGGLGILLFGGALDNAVHDDAEGDLGTELGAGGGNWIGKTDAFLTEDHLSTQDDAGNTVDRSGGAGGRISPTSSGGADSSKFASLSDAVYGAGHDGVSATITGGTLNAGSYSRTVNPGTADEQTLTAGDRNVTVSAVDKVRSRNEVIALAAGGLFSAGGGVAVTQVNSDVAAAASADQLRAARLTVKAASRDGLDDDGNTAEAVRVAGYAGAAGVVGVGAAVGVASFNGTVDAGIGGDIDLRDGAEVTASDDTRANVNALGASLSFSGAVGVAVAVADRQTSVEAGAEAGTSLAVVGDNDATLSDVLIRAEALGSASADAQAAAGGLAFAGNGAVAVANDDRGISAGIGANSYLASGGDLTVQARTRPDVYARAGGYGFSYLGTVGASVAAAGADTTVSAGIGDGSTILLGDGMSAGNLTVSAEQHAGNSGGDFADGYDAAGIRAQADAVNGAVYLAANAASAAATDRGSVKARVGDGVGIYHQAVGGEMPDGSSVYVGALREAGLLSQSSGIVGAALAVGASFATADSQASTEAYFGAGMGYQAGSFQLDAASVTDVVADAESGSGGIVAGAAADATSRDYASTKAIVGGAALIRGEDVDLTAHHQSRFRPAASSVQAAVGGMSGASSHADIDNYVLVQVQNAVDPANNGYARILGHELSLLADSDVSRETLIAAAPGRTYSVEGGAGGVINGAAADSDVTIVKRSRVLVGDDAYLRASNRPDATEHTGLASLTLLAGGSVDVHDRAYLESGGLAQFPYGSSRIDLTGTNAVEVGDAARLMSEDLLGLAAYETQARAKAEAVTKTWGGIGAAGATTDTDVAYDQTVSVGENSLLEGLGYTFLTAGRRADTVSTRAESRFVIDALSDTYNYTAAPVDTSIDAVARLDTQAGVSLGSGSQVIAGWDVAIGGFKGDRNVTGKGTGHNPYLEALSTETTERDETTTGSASLTLDGEVIAGYFNKWSFDVAGDGNSVAVRLNGQALDPNRAAQDADAYVDVINGFDAQSYAEQLNDYVASLGESYQAFADQVDTSGLPSAVKIVRIQDVTATQGNVLAYADAMSGSGSLEARGGAGITVNNASTAWLDVGNLNVIDNIGGRVLFSGAIASGSTGGVAVREVDANVSPAIAVVTSGNTGASSADAQPGLMVSDALYNQRGLVRLYNRNGNIYQGDVIQANQVQVVAPNGTYVIIAPDQTIHMGGTPWSAWSGAEWNIGASDVIAYALRDYVENVRGQDLSSSNELMNYLYRNWEHNSTSHDPDGDGDEPAHTDNYYGSLVPYNTSSLTGDSGDRPYVIFDKEYRQAKFDHVSLKPFSQTASYAGIDDSAAAAGGVRAQKVLILADVLDVNAPIIAGQETDITIDLDASVKADIDAWRGAGKTGLMPLRWYHESGYFASLPEFFRDLLGLPDADSASGEGWYALAPGAAIPFTADRTVSGHYDPASNQVVLNGVQGATTGYISVDAKIISTTQQGRLEVVNGYSDIAITNSTGYELSLNDISTGTAETGVIELTDRLKGERVWYVNRVGESTRKYVTSDLTTASWLDAGVARSYSDLDVYRPEQGTRYWWQRRYQAARSINSTDYFSATATPWEFADGDWNTGTTGAYNGDIIASGICGSGSCQYTGSADFSQQVTDTTWGPWVDWQKSVRYSFTYDESVAGWGSHYHTFRWPLRARMETRTSVRADYPIEIRFTGTSTGSIDISSNAAVDLAGRLDSRGGNVRVDAGSGSIGGDALISAVSADLSAGGDIGGIGTALRLSLDGGLLNASSSGGGIYLTAPAGDLRLGGVSAAGAVNLSADQSILGTGGGTSVTGASIELTAAGGRIGHESGGALRVQANGGRLDAAALDGVALYQGSGDVHVGSLVSAAGDVSLTAAGGNIVSATNLEVADLVPLAELRQRWAELGITGDGSAAAEAGIAAFEAGVEREYRRYWQFAQALERAEDGTLSVSDAGQRLYSGLAAANGRTVSDYVIGEYQRLDGYFQELLGTGDLSTVAGFDAFDGAWQYTASAERQAQFHNGAAWDERRLENAVNAAAVSSGAAGVSWLDDTLNISGRNVTLRAAGDIGSYGTHSFQLAPDTTITDAQRAWLLTAAPGGLQVSEAGGGAVDVDVRTLSRLRVAASGELDVQAGTDGSSRDVFIGANGDAKVQQLDADGEVYLGAQRGITYTGTAQTIAGAAEGLTLRAVTGSILGTDGGDFDLAIDGTLTGAIAGGSVRLRDTGGAAGLDVGILYAQDQLAVNVPGNLRQVQGRGFAIGARSLELNVGGDAGAVGEGSTGFAGPLNLAMRGMDGTEPALDGTVFGSVGGDLRLAADAEGLHLGGADLALPGGGTQSRGLDVGGALIVRAAGDLVIGADVASGSAALQSSGGLSFAGAHTLSAASGDLALIGTELNMAAGSSVTAARGRIDVGVTGDAWLGLLDSGMSSDPDPAAAVTVTAGGAIASVDPGSVNLRSAAAQGVQLSAGTDIGAADAPVVVDGGARLDADAVGSIYLLALGDVLGGDLSAGGALELAGRGGVALASAKADGELSLTADADLSVTDARAGGAASLYAGGDLAAATLDSATAGLDVGAGGALNVGAATSELSQLYRAAGDMTIGSAHAASGTIELDGDAAVSAGSLRADSGELRALAGGDLAIGTADSAQDQYYRAGGSLRLDTATAASGAIDALSTGDLALGSVTTGAGQLYASAADFTAASLTSGAGLQVDAGGAMAVDRAEAQGDIALSAGGPLRGGALVSHAGQVRVDAGAAAWLTRVDAAGDIIASAVGALDLGQLHAGRDLRLRSGGDLSLDGLTAGRDIDTASTGHTSGGPVQAGRNLRISAGYAGETPVAVSDIVLHSAAGASIDLRATGDIRIGSQPGHGAGGTVDAGGDFTASAGGGISFESTVTAGGNVGLEAVDAILVDVIQTLGGQRIDAGGELRFTALDAGGAITTRSGGDTSGQTVSAGGPLRMYAGGDLRLNRASAPSQQLEAGGALDVELMAVEKELRLEGQTLRGDILHTGDTLIGWATGEDGGLAETVDLNIDSAGYVYFAQFYADQARVDTSASAFAIGDGWITGSLALQTAQTQLYMNNVDQSVRDVDVQIYEPDQRFALRVNQQRVWTDAYVSHYRKGWKAVSPNYREDRKTGGPEVGGPSAERDTERALNARVREAFPVFDFDWGPGMPATIPAVGFPDAGPPVNLGLDDGLAEAGGGASDDEGRPL